MLEIIGLPIGEPARRALEAAEIKTLAQLCAYSEKELLSLHGIGPKAVRILKEKLNEAGLSLRSC